ncbi:hypothetical protein EMPS_02749 [Entomortierella parvispora]|uniref:Uncharacterized protein n=1 Tax=Entomortierella parvispora TaxID=205924 RepID=A0A9P3H5J5_9FUNG|nr:hypothetical protein EMPS_02749 [Entomortierella parvispora]
MHPAGPDKTTTLSSTQQSQERQQQSRPYRHQPVKIHSIITSSHTGSNLPRISPPSSFSASTDNFFASSPLTATTAASSCSPTMSPIYTHAHDHTDNSSNSSYPPSAFENRRRRVRADSTAAREAMESAIQARLDLITTRLDAFNHQSHELYARTQALAKEFTEKSKRMYRVEDHLLRIQGKPGLSESFIEHGGSMSRRRLTNDLEELSMGVRTLRKKFQVAGSVVATVGWWRHLKEMKDQNLTMPVAGNDGHRSDARPSTASSIDHDPESSSTSSSPVAFTAGEMPDDPESSPPGRSLSQKEGRSLQNIFIANEEIHSKSPTTSHPFMGLRSPPLTPKGPLAGSSLSSLQESSHHHHKSRPLSIIPDLEETSMALSGIASPEMTPLNTMNTTTVMMAEMPPSFPLIDDALLEKLTPSHVDSEQESNESNLRTEEGEERSALPSASAPSSLDVFSSPTAASEQKPQETDSAESQDTAEQLERIEREIEDDDWEAIENEPEMESLSPVQVASAEDASTEDAPAVAHITSVESLSESLNEETLQETAPLAEIDETDPSATEVTLVESVSAIDKEQDPAEQDCQINTTNDEVGSEDRDPEEVDGWVQALWRFLVRAEYFFLGTAVLGAFMPENWWALCAGFFSAVMYGMLVIRHRFLTSDRAQSVEGSSDGRQQGPVPPQPPKGNVRRRRVHAGSRSS